MTTFSTGLPGVRSDRTASYRRVRLTDAFAVLHPSAGVISGTASADAGNTGDVRVLRAGKVMGRITSGGKFAPSIIGLLGEAIDSAETAVDMASAAIGTELVRRIGSTGTFKITGPPTAGGTVRTLTATYSGISSATATITALGVNAVQTLTFGAAATGGTLRLRVPKVDGTFVITDAITWNATDATYLAAINTALDAATGVSGGIVATGAAPDTALTLTFSGTGFAAMPWTAVEVVTFPTSCTTANVVHTTVGVDGRFVTGSLVQPTDGSETPLGIIDDGYGVNCLDLDAVSEDQALTNLLVGGYVDSSQIVDWPADVSTRAWLVAQLKATGAWNFDHLLND